MPQPPAAIDQSLAGKTIAIAESRELELFAALLERRGARVLRYPMVTIIDAPDPAPVLAWLREAVAGACQDLVFLTGEGIRRLCALAERTDPQLPAAFVAALRKARKITRGPKPARALRELGMQPDLEAALPTTAGVIAAMTPLDLRGRTIGLQLYGSEPNQPLRQFLSAAGATVLSVAPYAYAEASDRQRVQDLVAQLLTGNVSAMAFTSKAQVERLIAVVGAEQARAALGRTQVAAVGPVVAEALQMHGVALAAMPSVSWFLKPLTQELARHLEAKRS